MNFNEHRDEFTKLAFAPGDLVSVRGKGYFIVDKITPRWIDFDAEFYNRYIMSENMTQLKYELGNISYDPLVEYSQILSNNVTRRTAGGLKIHFSSVELASTSIPRRIIKLRKLIIALTQLELDYNKNNDN